MGYKFVGWDKSIPLTMPSENVIVTAKFEPIATVNIKNNSGSKSVNYGEVLRLTAIVTNKPADANIVWYVDGIKKGEGETFNVSFESGTKTIEVKLVDASGNVLKDSNGNEIKDARINRLAAMAVSIDRLAHWRVSVTIHSYLLA